MLFLYYRMTVVINFHKSIDFDTLKMRQRRKDSNSFRHTALSTNSCNITVPFTA